MAARMRGRPGSARRRALGLLGVLGTLRYAAPATVAPIAAPTRLPTAAPTVAVAPATRLPSPFPSYTPTWRPTPAPSPLLGPPRRRGFSEWCAACGGRDGTSAAT